MWLARPRAPEYTARRLWWGVDGEDRCARARVRTARVSHHVANLRTLCASAKAHAMKFTLGLTTCTSCRDDRVDADLSAAGRVQNYFSAITCATSWSTAISVPW
jgi:hypothetical protein